MTVPQSLAAAAAERVEPTWVFPPSGRALVVIGEHLTAWDAPVSAAVLGH